LRRCHYETTGTALDAAALRSTLDLLKARALFDASERTVHVRIAEHAGHLYPDLANERWRLVEIGPQGWRAIGSPPVRFRRPAGMLPIPVPERRGSVEAPSSTCQGMESCAANHGQAGGLESGGSSLVQWSKLEAKTLEWFQREGARRNRGFLFGEQGVEL
jgi:hypothetical protein